ncbi:MAG TPA: AI-2E family transporter [Caldilineaceae bacterium]|nr:AI-2E family transporter [Caldilineaceae bacterium]
MGSRRWSNLTKIIVAATLAVLALVLLITFRVLIGPTVVAFLLAFILSYPVNWIQRSTGWARGLAVSVIYIVLLALVALLPLFVVPRLADLLAALQTALQDLITQLQNVSNGPFLALGPFRLSFDMLFQETGALLSNVLLLATGNPLELARGVTNSVITVVYVLVLNFWILKDIYKLQRLIMDMIPVDYQEDARRLGQELSQVWHAFLRGHLALALAMGVITWAPLVIVGMPNAGGLALLAGVMEFLPSIGPGISGTVGTVYALFQGSTWLPVSNLTFALIVLVIYIITAQVENIYLVPRLVGGRVQLHPAVAFVGIIAGTLVFGLLGVVLAMPIMASARILLSYIYRKLFDLEPFEPLKAPQAAIRIPGLIAGRKIDAIIFDLDGTLTELDWSAANWAKQHLRWLDRLVTPEQRCHLARRLMIAIEGLLNFVVSQTRRLNTRQNLEHTLPLLDLLRGYPPAPALTPIPGVVEMLQQLAPQYKLVLVSTRDETDIRHFFRNAGLSPSTFALILGRNDVRNLLPHSEALLTAAAQFLLEPSQVLMVSDTDSNLRAARAAEMATVGVLCGLAEEQDLQESDLVLATTPELLDWL